MRQSAKRHAVMPNPTPVMTAQAAPALRGPVPATQAATGTENDINGTLDAMMRRIEQIYSEVRSLRRDRQTGSAIVVESLCRAVHSANGTATFTASRLFEIADAPGNGRLGDAIDRTTSRKQSVRGLARFLKRSIGHWGPWAIRLLSEDGRDGNQYVIEKRLWY